MFVRHICRTGIRHCTTNSNPLILGIETSCDETGAAVVDGNGTVIGESLKSQLEIHLRLGGINPSIAERYHTINIEPTVTQCMQLSGISYEQLSAIAVTTRPGLANCLRIGAKYALDLARRYRKPIIPVHHMQAHALTALIDNENIKFPFLCLLISGGHALICFVEDVDEFTLLGSTMDNAPGEIMDKIARRLKLRNLGGEFEKMSGGAAMEILAKDGNFNAYDAVLPMPRIRGANMSFSGILNQSYRLIDRLEMESGVKGSDVICEASDVCASIQRWIYRHIAHRLKYALRFLDLTKRMDFSTKNVLVISGGVACNSFFSDNIRQFAKQYNMDTVIPEKKYCTDNGIMIAWNAQLLYRRSLGLIVDYPDCLRVEPVCKIGHDVSDEALVLRYPKDDKKLLL